MKHDTTIDDSTEDEYSYDDDFEVSSDISNEEGVESTISAFERYQKRINAKEICEVGFQQCPDKNSRHVAKQVETIKFKLANKAIQCCEGEDDSEFLEILEKCKSQRRKGCVNNIKFKDTINKTSLKAFLQKASSLFESILVQKNQILVQKQKKELTVVFGCGEKDQIDIKSLLDHSTLTYGTCFGPSSTVLTVHSVDRLPTTIKNSNLIYAKSIICIWQTYSRIPLKILVSEGMVVHSCVCVLKDLAIISGTKEGFIQLWDVRESLRSTLRKTIMRLPKEYSLEDDRINEERNAVVSLVKVSHVVVASLDNKGKVELWNMKEVAVRDCKNNQRKVIELVRFRVIHKICDNFKNICNSHVAGDDFCPVVGLQSTPAGDIFLCPMDDGRVAVLKLSNIQSLDNPVVYFPDFQVKGKDMKTLMYDSVVDQIVFSPFDQDIFFLKWTNGSFGLFHRSESIASIYFDAWNYSPEISSKKKEVDIVISIQWCQRRPCSFYLLTVSGYFLIFDLMLSHSPIKYKKIKYEDVFCSDHVEFIALIPSYSTKYLPKIVIKDTKNKVFSMKLLETEHLSFDLEAELRTIRSISQDRIKVNMSIER